MGLLSSARRRCGGGPKALLLAVLVALSPRLSRAGGTVDGPEKEYQVKAAFLYNFAKFVSWPESAFADRKAPLVIGVLGPDPFGDALEKTLEGKSIGERRIEIRRFESARDARQCHIVFVSAALGERQEEEAIGALADAPVLTVGEDERFTRRGGIIRFVTVESRIRFEANAASAKKAGLGLSSQLLKLALPTTGATRPDRNE